MSTISLYLLYFIKRFGNTQFDAWPNILLESP